MKTIQVWDVTTAGETRHASPVEVVNADETERLLEDLLVRTPDLLEPGLSLIGRQVPTEGGPLDLLAVDQDGGLVVYELKRGLLTRDAVAQVVDYGSYLADLEAEDLARLVENNSGRLGIPPIADFADWYESTFPNAEDALSNGPRMVIVGLGVDQRAERMVTFLNGRGLVLQLLTFHAFRMDGRLLLAKQDQNQGRRPPPTGNRSTKEGNRRILYQNAEQLGVTEFLDDVARVVRTHLIGTYQWPGRTSYAFSLPEQTSEGRPTSRAYVTLYLDQKNRGLTLNVTPRAALAGADAIPSFVSAFPAECVRHRPNRDVEFEIKIQPRDWRTVEPALTTALKAIFHGWQHRSAEAQGDLGDLQASDQAPVIAEHPAL